MSKSQKNHSKLNNEEIGRAFKDVDPEIADEGVLGSEADISKEEERDLQQIVEETFESIEEEELPCKYSVIEHDSGNELNKVCSWVRLFMDDAELSDTEQEYWEDVERDLTQVKDAVVNFNDQLPEENSYNDPEQAIRSLASELDPSVHENIGRVENGLESLKQLLRFVESYEDIQNEDYGFDGSYQEIMDPLEDDHVRISADEEVEQLSYVPAVGQLNQTIRKNDIENSGGDLLVDISVEEEGNQKYVRFNYESLETYGEVPSAEEMLSLGEDSGMGLGLVNYTVNRIGGDITELGENEDGNFELEYRVPTREEVEHGNVYGPEQSSERITAD